jgi:excisionase family DNA binding protein
VTDSKDPTTGATEHPASHLMTAREVADVFRVDTKTVTRWARSGKLDSIRTLGGHRRFDRTEVRRVYQQQTTERGETPRSLASQAANAKLWRLQAMPTTALRADPPSAHGQRRTSSAARDLDFSPNPVQVETHSHHATPAPESGQG